MQTTDTAEYDRAAEQLAPTFAATWNAKDGPAYGMAYWPDAELVDPTGRISDGRDAIVKTHEELWAATAIRRLPRLCGGCGRCRPR